MSKVTLATLAQGFYDARPHVVILGGGFAGLYAAKGLADAPVRITLVDRRNHHLFQPMLYQVATAGLNPSDIASPIRAVLRRQKNVEVVLGDAVDVNTATHEVLLADGMHLSYDYLIVATGARHSYFGRDEWEALAPGLKSLEDAVEIRNRALLAFELAEREPNPSLQQAYLTFVVVGGGPTGVEMAGALAEVKNYTLRRDFRHINPRSAKVILVEAGPALLPSYPEDLRERAAAELRRLGVEVRTNAMVRDIQPWSVTAGDAVIPTRTVVWAAGNLASPLLKTLNTPLDRQGRAIVEPDCSIPEHPEVFVLGDAAHFEHDGPPLPGVSPVAIQMGQYVARVIASEARDGRRPEPFDATRQGHEAEKGATPAAGRQPFSYWNKGQLAVIGRGHAVADIGRLHFGGFFAWLTWIFVHIFFLIGFRNRVLVLIQWAIAYFTYQRGARLITGEVGPSTPTTPVRTLSMVPPPPPAPAPAGPQPSTPPSSQASAPTSERVAARSRS
ncbi:MAG TPA: NAD(P)/FAD-dependent oxidoreductase [Gemmatimonadales bacterium]|nr:NAD(P)/FAD-dependent oxidoreductase [Gemmatimonadales bacterium]